TSVLLALASGGTTATSRAEQFGLSVRAERYPRWFGHARRSGAHRASSCGFDRAQVRPDGHHGPVAATRTWTDRLFFAAVGLKGVDGAVQLVVGVLLLAVPPTFLSRLVHAVVTKDLVGPPTGPLATDLEVAAQHLGSGGGRGFAIIYLTLHGVIKLALVAALWREIAPMYPAACCALAIFVVVEFLRAAEARSVALAVFGVLDVLIIVLVLREYAALRSRRRAVER